MISLIFQQIKNLVFILLILIPTIFFQDYLIIENINVSFLSDQYHISLLFTCFCFLVFLNAFNMFDGINLQASFYSFLILTFFIFNNYHLIFFISSIAMLLSHR